MQYPNSMNEIIETRNLNNERDMNSYEEKDVSKIIHISPRIGEARHTIADIKKIQTKLLWNPKINLEEWMKENT